VSSTEPEPSAQSGDPAEQQPQSSFNNSYLEKLAQELAQLAEARTQLGPLPKLAGRWKVEAYERPKVAKYLLQLWRTRRIIKAALRELESEISGLSADGKGWFESRHVKRPYFVALYDDHGNVIKDEAGNNVLDPEPRWLSFGPYLYFRWKSVEGKKRPQIYLGRVDKLDLLEEPEEDSKEGESSEKGSA
jgi:hypothetical protein